MGGCEYFGGGYMSYYGYCGLSQPTSISLSEPGSFMVEYFCQDQWGNQAKNLKVEITVISRITENEWGAVKSHFKEESKDDLSDEIAAEARALYNAMELENQK